ncbi:MAG: hypothetical protein JO233_09135 [Candidatus Eremiobacteraeota bacterium]|nr:hypothetical protein [Candidatus Eremiobacteraeota bacterium]
MQTEPGRDIGNTFSRAWQLLTSNWIIIVPGIVIAIVFGIITALLLGALTAHVIYDANGMPTGATNVGGSFWALALTPILAIIATILSITYTTGMAGAAWARGTTTLADGAASFREDAGHVLMAMIIMIVIGIIAAILAPFTLGLSVLAFLLFFIYTMPAAVVGNRPGMEAVSESFQMVMRAFGTTIVIVLLIFVISIIAGIIGVALHAIPYIGPIVGQVLQQIVVAFSTLVIVGEYLKLRAPAASVAGPSSSTTYTPPPPPPPGPTV